MTDRLPLVWALYKKEMRANFDTLTAYVVTVVILLISGYLFASPMFLHNQADLSAFVGVTPLLFLFFIPAVTMRLFAEEYKSGTIEILATLPVRDGEVLAVKYLGALSLITFMLAGTLVYPVTLYILGKPDLGGIFGSYLGLWLTAGLLTAVGVWASSLTRNQIVAFILAFLVSFALFLLGKVNVFIPPALGSVADFLGLDSHLANISRGVLDTRDLLYYLGLSGFFLYVTYLRVNARRIN
ncbi:MAG: ABC transporter permease [Elusimicrobiota bacterium]